MRIVLLYFLNSLRDFSRGLRHNYNSPLTTRQTRLRYQIIIVSHTLEKGLALRDTRPGFGEAKVRQLMQFMQGYDPTPDPFPIEMARGALDAYAKHHANIGFTSPLITEVEAFVAASRKQHPFTDSGGWKVAPSTGAESPDALAVRYSARDYAPHSVDDETLHRLIARAARAPSQCNRQSVRVHAYRDRKRIGELLQLQGGSAGFAEHVPNLLVISSELAAWGGPGQRNQGYVDAGLFAMCLMIACTEEGLACCPLNLAKTNSEELRIAACGGISAGERLVMMLAFGAPPIEAARAAASPRLPVDQLLTMHADLQAEAQT